MGGDLLVGVHLLQRILRDRDDLLLQLLADVLDLDDGLSFVHLSRHGFKKITQKYIMKSRQAKITLEIEFDETGVIFKSQHERLNCSTIEDRIKEIGNKERAPEKEEKRQIQAQSRFDINQANIWYENKHKRCNLLTDDSDIENLIKVKINVITFQYQEEVIDLEHKMLELQASQKAYLRKKQACEQIQMRNRVHDLTPRIAFLYAAPIHQEQIFDMQNSVRPSMAPPGTLDFTTNYMKVLDCVANTIKEYNTRLEIMEFKKSLFLESLTCKIVYVIIHAEDDIPEKKQKIYGEDQMGRIVDITYTESDTDFKNQTELLIIQSSCTANLKKYLEKSAKNIILINSNVLVDDETVQVFVRNLFKHIMKGEPINRAFDNCMKLLTRDFSDLRNRFLCCCFHEHDPKVCLRLLEPNIRYSKFHYSYHFLRCKCPERFNMKHVGFCQQKQYFSEERKYLNKEKDNLCCCRDSEIISQQPSLHDFNKKFEFYKKQCPLTKFQFQKGQFIPNVSLEPYRWALENKYKRLGAFDKKNLALVMWRRNEAFTANKFKFILNLHGPEGSGRKFTKNLVLNYLKIKRDIDPSSKEININLLLRNQQLPKAEPRQVVVILNATKNNLELKTILSNITNNLVILIGKDQIKIEGLEIKNLKLTAYTPYEAYDLIVRTIDDSKKEKKITRAQKDKLKQRLQKLGTVLYAGTIIKEVPKIEDRVSMDDYLQKNLKIGKDIKSSSQLDQAVLIYHQFQSISQQSYRNLLIKLNIQNQTPTGDIISKIPQDKMTEESQQYSAIMEIYKPMVDQLLMRALQFTFQPDPFKKRLYDSSTRNECSLLSLYLKSNLCRFKPKKTIKELNMDELYSFLKKNYGSQNFTRIVYPEVVVLCILVINTQLICEKPDKYMLTIITNIKGIYKVDDEELQIQKYVLRIILNEILIQINLMQIFSEMNFKNIVSDPTLNIKSCMKQIDTAKQNIRNLYKTEKPEHVQILQDFLAVVQFDLLLITVILETKFQINTEINNQDLPKLISTYDRAQSHIYNKKIIQDHGIRKEFIRLLLAGYPKLGLYNSIHIRKNQQLHEKSDLWCLYQLLQNRLMCTPLSEKMSKLENNARLQTLNTYIQIHQKYKQIQNRPCYIMRIVKDFNEYLHKQISTFLDQTPIFTLLTSLPIQPKQQCPERAFGVVLQFDLMKRLQLLKSKAQSVIFEHKALTKDNLQAAIKRGSKYMCLWFEYKSAKGDNYLALEKTDLIDEKDVEVMSFEEVLSFLDFNNSFCFKKEADQPYCKINTLFVCGNSQFGELALQKLSQSVVYFNLPQAKNPYEFYLKNFFQARMVEYFMKHFQLASNLENAYKDLMKSEQMPKQLENLKQTIVVKVSKNQNSWNQSNPNNLMIDYKSSKVYIVKMRQSVFKIIKSKRQINNTLAVYSRDVDVLNQFVNFFKILCEIKYQFPDGIFIVDWSQQGVDEQPVLFIDRIVQSCKLTVLARRSSLLIMKNYNLLLQKVQTKKFSLYCKTFPRLIEILNQKTKMFTLICTNQKNGTLDEKWDTLDLNKDQFKTLEPKESQKVIPISSFPPK